MTLLGSTRAASDAIRLLATIGDALGTHDDGFSRRVASTAANFMLHRGTSASADAAYYAGALHAIGAAARPNVEGRSTREATIAAWDDPVAGAALVRSFGGLPAATADIVRWHRECFDGTGFPDGLRWKGVPSQAMDLGIVRAFIAELERGGRDSSPAEALFALTAESGRAFDMQGLADFRAFIATRIDAFDAPFEPGAALSGFDARAALESICGLIDERDERTAGRGRRVAALAAALATSVDADPHDVALAARLTALGRLGPARAADDFDPLGRLGREARTAEAVAAAAYVDASPTLAPLATMLRESTEWFDGSGLPARKRGSAIDPGARVLAVANAADGLRASIGVDAVRIGAAGGTQFDPAVVQAFISSGEGSAT